MCVLVVEDEPLILMAVVEYLEDASHKVMAAANGAEALALIEQWPAKFSALVTDYHMPYGVNGGQLVERMRQNYPDIPMLIVTARADVVTAEFQERHGVEMLAKPYDPDHLVATVERLLCLSSPGPATCTWNAAR